MKRNIVLSLAFVMVLSVVAAGPVSAKEPLRGDMTMVLNQDLSTFEFGLFGCPEIAWFGSIDVDGTTYGMALYPLPGRVTGNGKITHFEESWKVWTEEFRLIYDHEAGWYSLDDCEPGDYVMAGTDEGVAGFAKGLVGAKARSNGVVEEALGPFAEWRDRRMHHDSVLGLVDFGDLVGAFGFYGDLRLN